MKKYIIITTAILFVIALSGCNREIGVETSERVALQVTSGIQTKAADNTWEAGDAIGIYMLETRTSNISEGTVNRKYSTSDGGSTFTATADQTIYLPVDGSKVDFQAYYPYQSTFTTQDEISLDVSSQTDLSAIDLMAAQVSSTDDNPLDKNHPTVAFQFRHLLTKLELNIAAGTGLTASDLTNLKVEISNQRTSGLYDPLLKTFGIVDEPVQTITLNTYADGTSAQAILLPCGDAASINPVIAGRELIFTLKATGEVFRWAIPDTKFFEKGDRNIYNITINRSGVSVTATIENWNYGNGEHGENGSAE